MVGLEEAIAISGVSGLVERQHSTMEPAYQIEVRARIGRGYAYYDFDERVRVRLEENFLKGDVYALRITQIQKICRNMQRRRQKNSGRTGPKSRIVGN